MKTEAVLRITKREFPKLCFLKLANLQTFVACVQDLRYAGQWLLLDPSENSINSYDSVETVGVDNGCPSSACDRRQRVRRDNTVTMSGASLHVGKYTVTIVVVCYCFFHTCCTLDGASIHVGNW